MNEEFTTKKRKKEFDRIFNKKIVPLFSQYGFEKHTKTSKRLFKKLEKQLSVFVFFEYKNRFGSYGISIAYFDEEYGDVYDDNYLVMVTGMSPSFKGKNIETLNLSVDEWVIKMKLQTFPFIENHSTYKSILGSDQFYISKSRENEIVELLKRKSK